MNGGPAFLAVAAAACLAACGCSTVHHNLDQYGGDVYYSPPPTGTPSKRLHHFQSKDIQIEFFGLLPAWSPDLADVLDWENPEHLPIYNLHIAYDYDWWDYCLLIGTLGGRFLPLGDYFFVDTFTVRVDGDILHPPGTGAGRSGVLRQAPSAAGP